MATITRTIAERVSAALGDNGMTWRTNDGVSLDTLADHFGGALEQHPSKPDVCRWVFPDGSVITGAGDAWDFGFGSCWCWAGCPGELHPASSGECCDKAQGA